MSDLIKINNLKNLSTDLDYIQIKVDRSSVLGNPFELTKEEDRNKICDAYQNWLWLNLLFSDSTTVTKIKLEPWVKKRFKIATNFKSPTCKKVKEELNIHVILLSKGYKLSYNCWCKLPDKEVRCHADSIKESVLDLYSRL